MIAVSSFRPQSVATHEIRRNQEAAHDSWVKAFDGIIYFGPQQFDLAGDTTEFVNGAGDFPTIEVLATACSAIPGWSCIINADIVVLPNTFRAVELELHRRNAKSAFSFRYEFDPGDKYRRTRNYDMGLDIFCATSDTWRRVADNVPEEFRIGHGRWDTWMSGFFNHACQPCCEFTGSRCILHPKHGSRLSPYSIPRIDDKYFKYAGPATHKVKCRDNIDFPP